MTKILYIPTGRYLEFYFITKHTEIILSCDLEEAFGIEAKRAVDYIIYNLVRFGEDYTQEFLTLNSLHPPMHREEFEIIYD